MIRDIHTAKLRALVEQARRDLAGWEFILTQAEQGERAGTVLPDPLSLSTPLPAPTTGWGVPMPPSWKVDDQPITANGGHPQGREPYTTSAAPLFDGKLPPEQEAKLGTLARMHDAYAATDKAREEEQEWRQA